MSQDRQPAAPGGIGFVGALTVLFVALKLTGHIDWSWWLVLSPLWIGAAFFVVVIVLALVFFAVTEFRR